MADNKRDIIERLRQNILHMEGYAPPQLDMPGRVGLGPIEAAFPNGAFPVGAIHEFLIPVQEHHAATSGFIGGILASLMQSGGTCIWVSRGRAVFPPALKVFGVMPHHMIFANVPRERDALWVAEEALKCEGLAAVICEVQEINFMQSRRLQLAAGNSKVTGFILRTDADKMGATACVARWHIKPVASQLEAGMPGVGFFRWDVALTKVRNGKPGKWLVEWRNNRFTPVVEKAEWRKNRVAPAAELADYALIKKLKVG